ncbi:MAG: acyl-CoA thioesterase [Deltaproteobacteria bacterium]|nr:acyl-CoA thioesterase [Candidatus Zymogenaceae bacterium]
MGFAYYGSYLRWFEIGRTEFLRELGTRYRDVEESGVLYPVTEAYVKYALPARYDDPIEIVTRLTRVKKASLRFDYQIVGVDGRLHASGWTVHAAVDRTGRVVRISVELVNLLKCANASPG